MKQMIHLHSMGHFHPEQVIDNAFLESLDIGTTDSWIMERTGIRERRTALPLDYIVETRNADPRVGREVASPGHIQRGARAAALALKRANLAPSMIGLVISGSSSIQVSSPAEACAIAGELGIDTLAYDLNSACTTFAAQLHHLDGIKTDRLPDFVLLVQPESNTLTVNYNDRNSAVLFGDAATAAVVSPRIPAAACVTKTVLQSSTARQDKVIIPTAGHFDQDGPAVQRFAVRKTAALFRDLSSRALSGPRQQTFIGHQANKLMLESALQLGGWQDIRHLFNVDVYGNCGSAGAPSVLSQYWPTFQAGDSIVLTVVGAGLSWGGVLIEFVEG